MTTISSATSRASSWSWVTNTVVTWTSSWRRRSQSRSSLRTLASSAPNGSSSSSTPGSTARARARAIRWRWPPESWDGKPVGELLEVHELEQLVDPRLDLGLGALADLEAEGHVAVHGEVLERGVVLEHEADVALLRRQVGGVDALDLDAPGVGLLEAGDDAQQRRLAATAGAEQRGELAGGDADGDVVEGDEVAEALADARDLDAHLRFSFGRMSETITMQLTATSASRNAVA